MALYIFCIIVVSLSYSLDSLTLQIVVHFILFVSSPNCKLYKIILLYQVVESCKVSFVI
jgi:hypothetical protein